MIVKNQSTFLLNSSKDNKLVNSSVTGAQILVKTLCTEDVELIWGYPGGSVLCVYKEICKQKRIEYICVRHEQAAIHAADGYARATGNVGVALVTSGPGITNAVTGIATAHMDSVPIVVITGNVCLRDIGEDSFQECNTISITRSITKHNFLVTNIIDLATIVKKAFYIARTGRPGPVIIDIPRNIFYQKTTDCVFLNEFVGKDYPFTIQQEDTSQIQRAVSLLLKAKCPYIYTGGGIITSNSSSELKMFVEILNFPITNTLMGLGGFPGTHLNFLGMLGIYGTYTANISLQHCDVLIAIGTRFDDRAILNIEFFSERRNRKIIHIDIDPSVISKRIKADIAILGDVKSILKKIIQIIQDKKKKIEINQWWNKIQQWRKTDNLKYDQTSEYIKPQFVIEKIWEITKGDAFICSDVGQHQMWIAHFYKFNKPRHWINSGGFGTMGVGLPYAIGVKKKFPNAEVITITSDGSIQMCIQELSTCLQYNIPIKIISLNNRSLGMIQQWKRSDTHYDNQSYANSLPNFAKLAEAYGHVGMIIKEKKDVERKLLEAFQLKNKTVFMDFYTDPFENIEPMTHQDIQKKQF